MLADKLARGDVIEVYFESTGVLRWVMPTIRIAGTWMCRPVERVAGERLDAPGAFIERGDPVLQVDDDVEVRVLRYQRDVIYPTRLEPTTATVEHPHVEDTEPDDDAPQPLLPGAA